MEHEIAVLEEDRIALDRVAVKLEKELREAMNTAGIYHISFTQQTSSDNLETFKNLKGITFKNLRKLAKNCKKLRGG